MSASPPPVHVLGPTGAPAVLLLHPWWGLTPAMHWWAEQLAAAGRRVVMPDLYRGTVLTTVADAEAHQQATGQEQLMADVLACAEDLAAEGQPWAAMGFSMGAAFACDLAGRGSADPDVLVLFYGGWKPHGSDVRTRAVDLHVVPEDEYLDDDERAMTVDGFTAGGAEVTVHSYDGCGHWFAEAGSPSYDAAATAMALSRVLDRLQAGPS